MTDARDKPSTNDQDTVDVILPPPEIRAIIDKTAMFVGTRGGVDLESKIRDKERGNSKFSFLNGGDPYYGYYQVKLVEARSGKTLIEDTGDNSVPSTGAGVNQSQIAPAEPRPLTAPVTEFLVDPMPCALQDLEIIKLTAQFVARNGRQFMTQLQQKEARNSQFDFLRHGHSMFTYFSKLVEQYTKILLLSPALQQKLEHNINEKYGVLARCVHATEYARYEEENKRKQKNELEQEKLAFQQIDWHDFVVVQAVEITSADGRLILPPPLSIELIQSMTLAQRKSMFGGSDNVKKHNAPNNIAIVNEDVVQ